MKETTELFVAAFKSVNTASLVMADKKLDPNDLQYILPLVFSWQAAIKDLTFAQEASKATGAQVDAAFATAAKELTNLAADTAVGVTNAAKGYYSTYWLAVKDGAAAGKSELLAEIKAFGLPAVLAAHNA